MTATITPDSEHRGLVALLPAAARPYALLARLDRPIGWWLLFWPGAWAVALSGQAVARWDLIAWLLIGSIAMRGAGCVYNDIVDRDLDARVERTRTRPLPSGQVSVRAAWGWLVALALTGLIVWFQLGWPARIVALASLALVAAYPFMKRITWWPQAWLGIVFSWAAPVAWIETAGEVNAAGILLYLGSIAWVIGYDTLYAVQDVEDDALAGIRSSARALGPRVRAGVAVCYALALAAWGGAIWQVFANPLAIAALLPAALHLIWQVATLDRADPMSALVRFRSNRNCGALIFMAMLVVGQASIV
ncbi:4-hydroxybenzoate octaprenyltransferase [Sphingomonas sp. BGYR3]|uniref:4-hydroxybenzoate octaprenyltransferase n=1 Tax=Sphingomonas sp. BGYR3 TaxID=2975483 RepID=UPI0021A40DEC|nr:4-hydroxybenzoate octaprenyltransferase [Sphingomonas sp. BGYR3]MDG5488914.1 4-hydroxybenzoate octaprenyltransferase [Sphingomonas sp. BGYR3]